MNEKVKMIGIGAGNSQYEVDSYRKRYDVPFPLFPDESTDFSLQLGAKGTPTFIGLRVNKKGVQEHFFFWEGTYEDNQKFLNKIIEASGL